MLRGHGLLWRLGVVLLVVQGAAMGIGLPILRGRLLDRERAHATEELTRLTDLVAERVRGPATPTGPEGLTALLRDLGARLDVELAVFDDAGSLRADSRADARDPVERFRPEVVAALGSGFAASIRPADADRAETVYVARRAGGGVVRAARPLAPARRRVAATVGATGAIGAGAILATLAAVIVAARRLRATMSGFADGAARLAAGDLDHRIAAAGDDDAARLAHALNDMAAGLEKQITALRSQQSEQRTILESMGGGVLALDVEQRVISANGAAERILGIDRAAARGRLLQEIAREPELNRFVEAALDAPGRVHGELHVRSRGDRTLAAVAERLRDQGGRDAGLLLLLDDVTHVRRLEAIRSDFAANVSHELRTPITSIKGYAETLLEVGLDDGRSREFLEIIHRSARRLEAIVDDLLALARIEHGGREVIDVEARPCAVGAIVDASVGLLAEAARAKSITLTTTVEPGLTVVGARHLLEQALANLLSNAIKYSGSGTTVTISGRRRSDPPEIEIAVRDEGPGIAPEHLPRLFERFYRVDRARSRALGGTGLGLAIVKHIAIAHGGRPEVESAVGRGSTFRIVLPDGTAAATKRNKPHGR
jgi:two-component system phosphate regulon sensor histidine kinase PhoR